MTPLMISAMVFLTVAGLVGVLAFVLRDSTPQTVTRLDLLVGKRSRDADRSQDILRKQAFESDKKSLLEAITPRFMSFQKLIEQADVNIKPSSLFGLGLLIGVTVATGSSLFRMPWWLVPQIGLFFFTTPFLFVWWKRSSRLKKFSTQLSDALELVARALRAGHSLAAGMHVVAEEMPSPIADEFRRVFEEQNLGIPIEDAMRAMCERVPNLDLRFFVTSVAIQRQTGGDLAEILDKIGYVIRERFRILGQVKALTGEGRLSGVVLILLPFALFIFMLNTKPDYMETLWTTDLGKKMSVSALIGMVVGAVVIRKIVNIKV